MRQHSFGPAQLAPSMLASQYLPPAPAALELYLPEIGYGSEDIDIDVGNERRERLSQLQDEAALGLIPSESKTVYIKRYNKFVEFIQSMRLEFNEEGALCWAVWMKESGFAPNSLYSIWASVKSVLASREKIYATNWNRMKQW